MTKEEFLKKAHAIYGDKYCYERTILGGHLDKICVTCKEHGDWYPVRKNFLSGHGCPECAKEASSSKQKKSIKQFVEDARKKHGDKYDYSKAEYKNAITKVCIICPTHGEFWQTPNSHLNGCGCKKCGDEFRGNTRRFTKEKFIERSRQKWGDKYSYGKTDYVDNKTKVCITCKKHGDFWQSPANHMTWEGCPVCARLQNNDLVFGIGINDEITPATKCHKAYNHWQMILKKCFDQEYKAQHPTYKNVTMCEEWKRFSVFKKWFDANYVEGYDLDKDLLSDNGRKMYSPDTCCFIPHNLNVMLCSKKNGKDGFPRGIRKEFRSYAVRVCLHKGKRIRIGKIRSIGEAIDIYNKIKREDIASVALEYYKNGLITKRVYYGFLNYDFRKFVA